MKTKLLHFLVALVFTTFYSLQTIAQCNEWVVTGGTETANMNHFGTAADSFGNVFTAYWIDSSYAEFNGDILTNSVLQNGEMLFIAKVDSSGNNVWTNILEMNFNELTHDIHSNGSDFYLTTTFRDSLIIGGQTIVSNEPSILVAKFDDMGNVVWFNTYELQTTTLQTATRSWATGLTVDNNGNVLVTGYFGGKLVVGTNTLETTFVTGQREMFLIKLDEDGNELWAIQSTGTSALNYVYNRGWALTADQNNDIYVGGLYGSNFTIGSISVSEPDNFLSPYLAKIDGNTGNAIWIQNGVFPVGSSVFSNFYDATVDKNNNVIVTGMADATLTIAGNTINSTVAKPIVVLKFDTNGNFIFGRNFGSDLETGSEWGTNIETDIFNNIYFSGNVSGNTSFDNFSINNIGDFTGVNFLATLDSMGNVTDLTYIKDPNGIGYTYSYTGVYDGFENVYLAGIHGDTDFLSINGVSTPTSSSTYSRGCYLVKTCVEKAGFNVSDNAINLPPTFTAAVHPNPNTGNFRLNITSVQNQAAEIRIISEVGQLIATKNVQLNNGENTILYNLEKLSSGMYFVQIRTNQYNHTQRFVKF